MRSGISLIPEAQWPLVRSLVARELSLPLPSSPREEILAAKSGLVVFRWQMIARLKLWWSREVRGLRAVHRYRTQAQARLEGAASAAREFLRELFERKLRALFLVRIIQTSDLSSTDHPEAQQTQERLARLEELRALLQVPNRDIWLALEQITTSSSVTSGWQALEQIRATWLALLAPRASQELRQVQIREH
jgi:hypothetical protein